MTPLELLARLAALIPPPRHLLVRFHGVFAPRSSWRRAVVPKPRPPDRPSHNHAPKPAPRRRAAEAALTARLAPPGAHASRPPHRAARPNHIAVNHWDRLKSGALLAASPRVDWPTLMRRTFDVEGRLLIRTGPRV